MARDIPTIERQVMTQGTASNPGNSYAELGNALGQFGQLATTALANVAIEKSEQAGIEAGLAGSAPQNLMPGFTRATAAYNKGVVAAENRMLVLKGTELLMEEYNKFSNPATFNSDSPALFSSSVEGVIGGVLETARPETHGTIKLSLQEVSNRLKGKMVEDALAFDNRQQIDMFKTEMSLARQVYNEAILTGDPEAKAIALENISAIVNQYGETNETIKASLPAIKQEMESEAKVNEIVAGYIGAYGTSRESAAQFLDTLSQHKPEGLTTEEWFKAQNKIATLQAQNNRLTAQRDANLYQRGVFEINTDQYDSLEDLTNEYSSNLDAADVYKLQNHWLAHNAAKIKRGQSVQKVLDARRQGPQDVAKLDNKTLNEFYADRTAEIINGLNDNLQDGQDPRTSLTLTERMQMVVAEAGAPIPDYNIDLGYGLKSDDPIIARDALNAYRYAWRNRNTIGDVLKGLDKEADDIAQYVLALGTLSETEEDKAILQAQQNVRDKSAPVMQARRDRLNELYRVQSGSSKIQSFYKSTFDTNPKAPEMDAHYGQFQKNFEDNFMGIANGDADIALKLTVAQLRDWGKSKYGAPDDMMYTPPEKAVALSDTGHWLNNQVLFNINFTLKKLEDLRDSSGKKVYNIKRTKQMTAQIPEQVSEADVMWKNYSQYPIIPQQGGAADFFFGTETARAAIEQFTPQTFGTVKAVIDNVERDLYLASTADTRNSFSGQPVYQWYYNDDYGVRQYLPDPNNPLGVAQFTVQPLSTFLPIIAEELSNEDLDELAIKYATEEFNVRNPKASDFASSMTRSGLTPRSGKLTEYVKENKERIKKELIEKLAPQADEDAQ